MGRRPVELIEVELVGGPFDGDTRTVPRLHVSRGVPLIMAAFGHATLVLGGDGPLLGVDLGKLNLELVRYRFQAGKGIRRNGRWLLHLDEE